MKEEFIKGDIILVKYNGSQYTTYNKIRDTYTNFNWNVPKEGYVRFIEYFPKDINVIIVEDEFNKIYAYNYDDKTDYENIVKVRKEEIPEEFRPKDIIIDNFQIY